MVGMRCNCVVAGGENAMVQVHGVIRLPASIRNSIMKCLMTEKMINY
jgi:hypothetical protein